MKPLALERRAGTRQIHAAALDLSVEADGCIVHQISSTVEVPWSSGLRKADGDQNKKETCCLGQAPGAGKKVEHLGKFKRPIWQGLK